MTRHIPTHVSQPVLRQPFSNFLHRAFDVSAHNLSRIVFEAYILANMHVLRCLKDGLAIGALDQSFFNSCCSNVSASTRTAGSEELRATAEQYFLLRPAGFKVMNTAYLSPAMCSHAKQMESMTKNHVQLNIVQCQVSRKQRQQDRPSISPNCCLRAESASAHGGCEGFSGVAWWLQPIRRRKGEEEHSLLPYKKLYEILTFYETLDPNTRGLKKFSLLPLKHGYIDSFFQIDSTTLPEVLRLLDREVQREIVRVMISRFQEGSEERTFLQERLTTRAIFNPDFQKKKKLSDELWRVLFRVEDFETNRRRFAKLLSTNGYGASIYLQVPKVENLTEFHTVEGLSNGYDAFIGIDPGRDYVCSAYAGAQTAKGRSKCIQVSTKELRHDSKVNQQKRWMRKQVNAIGNMDPDQLRSRR